MNLGFWELYIWWRESLAVGGSIFVVCEMSFVKRFLDLVVEFIVRAVVVEGGGRS